MYQQLNTILNDVKVQPAKQDPESFVFPKDFMCQLLLFKEFKRFVEY